MGARPGRRVEETQMTESTSDGEARPNADLSQLKSFVERVEGVNNERRDLADEVAAIYKEVKRAGLNVKAFKEVVRLRARDPEERRAHRELVDMYAEALGDA